MIIHCNQESRVITIIIRSKCFIKLLLNKYNKIIWKFDGSNSLQEKFVYAGGVLYNEYCVVAFVLLYR